MLLEKYLNKEVVIVGYQFQMIFGGMSPMVKGTITAMDDEFIELTDKKGEHKLLSKKFIMYVRLQ